MKLLDVEGVAQFRLGGGAGLGPDAMADLVTGRLPRLGAVAFDLPLAARLSKAGLFHHIGGRLLAAPALGVNAGVDHQPRRAEEEGLEIARAVERRRIAAQLIRQLFGIKRPAFGIGAHEGDLAQHRDIARGLRGRNLQMMARHAFMIGERAQPIFRPVAHIFQVDEIDGRARPVERGAVIIAVRRTILDLDRHGADFQPRVGNGGKSLGQLRLHRVDVAIELGEQGGAALRVVGIELGRLDIELGQPLAHGAAGIARALEDGVELRADVGDLLQPHGVNLVGGQVGRGGLLERGGVDFIAARGAPHAVAGRRARAQRLDRGDLFVERGIDRLFDDRARLRLPVARDALGRSALHQRLHHRTVGGRLPAQLLELAQRQVERPGRRQIAARRFVPLQRRVSAQIAGEGVEPRDIGFAIGAVVDRVRGIEEVGGAEIAAALLEDAIGPLHAVEAEGARRDRLLPQRIEDDVEVEALRVGQAGALERLQLLDRGPGRGQFLHHARLAVVVQLALRAGARALVEAKAGDEHRRQVEHALEDGGEGGGQARIVAAALCARHLREGARRGGGERGGSGGGEK